MAHIFEEMFEALTVPPSLVADIRARELAQRVTRGFACPHSSWALTSTHQLQQAAAEDPQLAAKILTHPAFRAAAALLR